MLYTVLITRANLDGSIVLDKDGRQREVTVDYFILVEVTADTEKVGNVHTYSDKSKKSVGGVGDVQLTLELIESVCTISSTSGSG